VSGDRKGCVVWKGGGKKYNYFIILLFIFGQTKICHGKDKNTPNVTHNYASLVVGKGSLV
jgi:hypothetical protein